MNLWVASSNIYRIKVGNHLAACVYDILKHEKLVLTLAALEKLEDRLREV
jgi:large subunit ribosomal protein L4